MKVFGIAGCSGTGKTTLLEQVIPLLTARGLKVSVIKHAHHGFDIDRPGKDTFRHREAGASEVLVSCGARWALMHEVRDAPEPTLDELLRHLAPCDLVLVEGYKSEPIPKLEVYRPAAGKPALFPERRDIVALATDVEVDTELPCLDLNDPAAVAAFIVEFWKL
jgi:molybdopterin-guanine dinucleotide biosynthesis protein B